MSTRHSRTAYVATAILMICAAMPVNALNVSPPSWWVGMKHQQLDLMLHHPNIASYTPTTVYEGVNIDDFYSPGGENYLIIKLSLSQQILPGVVTFTLQNESGENIIVNYKLNARDDGSATRDGFDSSDVIYLIAPDRFANGNPQNDRIEDYSELPDREYKGGRHGGDIAGITANLDYLKNMGFTQIWTMPLLENAMPAYSYHGYSTTNYYQIDPRFGTNEEYRQLSRIANEKGIGIIKDVVLNHIGSEHVWMQDKPSDDWINHNFEFVPTNHRREALHDPHGVLEDELAHTDGWFVSTMPDLNQRNSDLASYLIQHAIWWIEYANLSGLRVDTYSYADKDFLSAFTTRVMSEYPNVNIVGEEWSTNPVITAYWQQGSMRYDDYQTALPSVMDFPLQAALTNSLTNQERWDTGLRQFYDVLASDFLYGDPYNLVVFADNHDMSRISSQLNDNYALWDMAMTMLLTTRGIPQIFYGTEILMNNPGTDDHGIIRSDFPGGFAGDNVNAFTGAGLTDKQKKAQNRMRLLLQKRQASEAITKGKLIHFTPDNGTYVYFRKMKNEPAQIMVAVNKNTQEIALNLARFSAVLNNTKTLTTWRDGTTATLKNTVLLPAMSATVWTLNQE